MFGHITSNWRERPLVRCQVGGGLSAATTTRIGRQIRSRLDANQDPPAVKVSDEQMESLAIRRDGFHGAWN